MFFIAKSGIDVTKFHDGHKNINNTRPMNFNVNVKYFYFYYENGVVLNFNFLIGIEKTYPNKNEVITEPPVIDVIPIK